jgi:hypothetical protein
MIYKRAEPYLMRAKSVKALGSSLSSRSKPPLKSTRVQRLKNLIPLGGIPPVFWNRAMASSRFAPSGFIEKCQHERHTDSSCCLVGAFYPNYVVFATQVGGVHMMPQPYNQKYTVICEAFALHSGSEYS